MSGVGGGADKEEKREGIQPLVSCQEGVPVIGLIFRSFSVVH